MTRSSRRHFGRGAVIALILLGGAAGARAQEEVGTGRIVGRIVDAQSGAGLPGVTIRVEPEGSAVSGVDGRYMVNGVPAGAASITAHTIGYATRRVTGVLVPAGGTVAQPISLKQVAISIAAIEVSAGAERGSVGRALNEQRTSAAMINAITAEQMSRSPDGDAAAALQRVSGVTVQDGRYVSVRGLGERYTTTSLNGARIPSPEPERKVVPLDLFPTGLLQSITTFKTFTPDQPGDFSGASVNIRTREFPAERQLTVSTGFGFNDRVTGATLFAAPTTGMEWLGRAGAARALPGSVAAGEFTHAVTQPEFNGMVNDFRNAWSAERQTGRGSSSLGASLGGTDPLFGQAISYLLSGTWSLGQEVRSDEVRARALTGADGRAVEVDRFVGSTGRNTMAAGGLLNTSTLVGQHSRLFFNGTYNRTADNEARFETGTSENHGGIPMRIERLRFVERSVYSAQLGATHELGRHRLGWTATASGVRRAEPDRSEFVTARTEQEQPFRWFAASNEGAVRSFADLHETAREVTADWQVRLGSGIPDGPGSTLRFGALYRETDRDAASHSYSISALQLPADGLALPAEQIFDGRFTGDGQAYMRVTPLSQGGTYAARDRIAAGFAMADFGMTDRVRVTGGARIERSELDLLAQATIGNAMYPASPTYTDVLPSLAIAIGLTDAQDLRFSASQTLARPEYRELANVMYREVIGGDNVIGNPDLRRTLIRNADVRWEWFPSPGEIMSASLFAKQFRDPIERVYRATSGTSVVTFLNASRARNFGVELEVRKRLGFLADDLEGMTVFTNVTVMDSEISIPAAAAGVTNSDRAMVGQAPYVVNAGFTWAPADRDLSATVLYNAVGERITSAGEVPLPDVVEAARQVLDVSLRTRFTEAISLKLDAKNLLDAPHAFRQGDVVREAWRSGRSWSVGLSWRR